MTVVIDRLALRHPEKAHRPDQPIQRKPDWIRVKAPVRREYATTSALMREHRPHTVCEEAACPNIGECWTKRHATMMIMGDTCTRACAFCNVNTGLPGPLDADEPAKSPTRSRSSACAMSSSRRSTATTWPTAVPRISPLTITAIRGASPGTTVEVLTPDFLRKPGAIEIVMAAQPDVFNHNLETVPRLYPTIRPGARYYESLRLLDQAKELDPEGFTKSGLMVGLGECREEIMQVMDDLRAADVDFLTIGQYLQPTGKHAAAGTLLDAGGIRRPGAGRPRQRLPDGVGDPADAFVLSCRQRFRRAEGGARLEQVLGHSEIPIVPYTADLMYADRGRCGALSRIPALGGGAAGSSRAARPRRAKLLMRKWWWAIAACANAIPAG